MKRKVKFIIETQVKNLIVQNPVRILKDFEPSALIGEGIVTKEGDSWICEAELPGGCLNLFPAIGCIPITWRTNAEEKRVIKRAELVSIGLSEHKNEDPTIQRINQNKQEQ